LPDLDEIWQADAENTIIYNADYCDVVEIESRTPNMEDVLPNHK